MKRRKLSLNSEPGMLALLDGDLLCYRIGFTIEEMTDPSIGLIRLNKYIDDILFNSWCSDYVIYLTDSKGNYRNQLYPEYKANRTQPKPRHYQSIRDALIQYENAIVAHGQEADDALGIHQTQAALKVFEDAEWLTDYTTCICSIDKDLLQVPGHHYNFVKDKHVFVTEEEGKRSFYKQLLTGDLTDNIPGLYRIGPKKAEKILEGCSTDEEYQTKIIEAYKTSLGLDEEAARERVTLLGRRLWVRRKEEEMWGLIV